MLCALQEYAPGGDLFHFVKRSGNGLKVLGPCALVGPELLGVCHRMCPASPACQPQWLCSCVWHSGCRCHTHIDCPGLCSGVRQQHGSDAQSMCAAPSPPGAGCGQWPGPSRVPQVPHIHRTSACWAVQEDDARWFFQQLIVGLDYCHKMGVVNRDIKACPAAAWFGRSVCEVAAQMAYALQLAQAACALDPKP